MLLRPATPADEAFLVELYASTRSDEMAATGWDDETVADFLRMQFNAQRQDYQSRFPHATHDIVVVQGEAAGRIWVDRRPDEIRLLDLAVAREHRNRGLGTALIRGLQREAATRSTPLRHSVLIENVRALRLYTRLGFEVVGGVASHHLMEWTSASTSNRG